ncbi:MAG TPA: nuclear transport factor 2 family protein [Ktedonobacteraceae bacterium]
MSQLPCGHIAAIIQKITQNLQALDDQSHALEVKGMNLMHPWAYVVLQRQVDRLAKKKRTLQDAWDRAMTDLAICRSLLSPRDPGSSQSHRRGSARLRSQTGERETPATVLVEAAQETWEKKDASTLASYLSDDLTCRHMLPQSVGKAQVIAFMQAITSAFPDWSFNGHLLDEEGLAEQCWHLLYVTEVTATHMGYFSLPTLPGIPATGRRIRLGFRHLEFLVANGRIKAIDADFSPSGLEEVLAQLGLELP